MTYVIIHSNPSVLDKSVVKTINTYLDKKVLSLDEVCNDPDFCIVQHEELRSIKIEQIKQLQKKLLFSPFNRMHQFGIIKNAQLMTPEAQNALLKTLEECHDNTILILTVNNESSVLETILSRCHRIYPNEQNSEDNHENFSEQEQFVQKPLYEKIREVENIIKEKKVDEFLENLTKFFRKKYTQQLQQGEDSTKEKLIITKLTEARHRISKNVNTKIALEYICFQLDKYF